MVAKLCANYTPFTFTMLDYRFKFQLLCFLEMLLNLLQPNIDVILIFFFICI